MHHSPRPPSLSRALGAPLLLALASACAGPDGDASGDADADADELTWWRDVEPIVREKCGKCHVDGGIGPFALTSHADFVTFAPAVAPAIASGQMPPWSPDDECNEYAHPRSLSPEQEETLRAYVEGDMPEGDLADAAPVEAPSVRPLAPDLMLEMPEPFTPAGTVTDDYRCFLIPWPADITEPRFVTGLEVYPGERRIVHHVIVYAVTPGAESSYLERDDVEPGPGYTCFGGPGPTDGSARWLGAWVPGMAPFFAPEGVGQQVDPGTTLVMQVHYHPIGVEVADRSAIGLELSASVARKAEILPLADLAWLAGDGSMSIPAGEAGVTHEVTVTRQHPVVANAIVGRLGLPADTDLEIVNVGMHMHLFGTRGRVELRGPDGGAPECLLDIPRWDFNWQSSYDFVRRPVWRAGQDVHVQCTWDNSAANQPVVDGKQQAPIDRDWGDRSLDEMCLGILYVTSAQQ